MPEQYPLLPVNLDGHDTDMPDEDPRDGRPSPYQIEDLRTEQLLLLVPTALRTRITHETLRDLRRTGDWASTRATIIAWVESGFVLVDAAAALNIHRNTLVYRLNRLADQTGRATSDRRHWLALYMTCLTDRPDGPVKAQLSQSPSTPGHTDAHHFAVKVVLKLDPFDDSSLQSQ